MFSSQSTHIPKVSVGIPAHNEAGNIASVLQDVLRQKQTTYFLKEIVVYCDGCSDDTANQARSVDDPRILILESSVQKGVLFGLNTVLRKASGDILIILNADILIQDCELFEKVIKPIVLGKADLVSGVLRELPPENFLEEILSSSMEFKRDVFESFRGGNNLYRCIGPLRALTRDFYSEMEFHSGIADDMYTYLSCVSRGFTFAVASNAIVFYKLPSTLRDYCKQSFRYMSHMNAPDRVFDRDTVKSCSEIPVRLFLVSGLKIILKHPVNFLGYVLLVVYRRVAYFLSNQNQQGGDAWESVRSSKISR